MSLLAILVLALTAYMGADDGGSDDDSNDSGASGNVVDRQPPGLGEASADRVEYMSDTPGGLACEVSDDELSFSYIIGGNEVVLGGGRASRKSEDVGTGTFIATCG